MSESRKLQAIRKLRDALRAPERQMADLMLLALHLFLDEKPVGIELMWYRRPERSPGEDSVSMQSVGAVMARHSSVTCDRSYCVVYLSRGKSVQVIVRTPLPDVPFDLVATVSEPADGALMGPTSSDWVRRMVFRNVEKQLTIGVSRTEYGCRKVCLEDEQR